MIQEYSFTERTAWMLQARTLLDAAFYPRIAYQGRWVVLGGSTGSAKIQRVDHIDVILQLVESRHVDAIVQIMDSAQTLTIDEKIDSKNRSTIFCETVSVKEAGKPGWMVPGISQADILLWAFSRKNPQGLAVYMFWLKSLIDWFWPRKEQFRQFEIPNRQDGHRWTTVGHSVPINYIPSDCIFRDKELIKAQLSLW